MSLIEVSGLGKSYGPLKAVQNLSFAVEKGEILSLVGPDGAGKTSTFRAICGLISFDEGDIRIAGHDLRLASRQARQPCLVVADL